MQDDSERQAKIDELRRKIRSGKYQPDARETAAALVERHIKVTPQKKGRSAKGKANGR